MTDEFLRPIELLLLLGVFGGPVYLAGAATLLLWLRHRRHAHAPAPPRVLLALLAAVVLAVPLTVLFWWASGLLPDRIVALLAYHGSLLGYLTHIGLPAIGATTVSFVLAGWYLRRAARPAT